MKPTHFVEYEYKQKCFVKLTKRVVALKSAFVNVCLVISMKALWLSVLWRVLVNNVWLQVFFPFFANTFFHTIDVTFIFSVCHCFYHFIQFESVFSQFASSKKRFCSFFSSPFHSLNVSCLLGQTVNEHKLKEERLVAFQIS